MKQIILASSSPRRKELLEKHHIDFIVEFQSIEEVLDESLTLSSRLEKLAYQKAAPIIKRHPNDIVISGDTMVCLEQEMLGKPKDRADAKRMLQQLSNKTQTVYSAVCVYNDGKITTFCETCDVTLKELTEEQIEAYLDTNEWMQKAGAYAVQGIAKKFVSKIDGDIETVIGLPVKRLKSVLENMK